MSEKFQDKYRIPSARLQNWDYGSDAAYFITICTKERDCIFGDIAIETRSIETRSIASLHTEPFMRLNEYGKLAEKFWLEIPERFLFVELDAFVIMPNHIHGILIIHKHEIVETRLIASPQAADNIPKIGGITGIKNPMLHENISRIIRWYKGRTTFEIRKLQPDFALQSRFYDHIIRTQKSFDRIQNYIINNLKIGRRINFINKCQCVE